MIFPESPRVIYDNNPLAEVICQLRFPPILRIDAEVPAGFQEEIRDEYPKYRKSSELPAGLPAEVATILKSAANLGIKNAHEFASLDDGWVLTLTHDFIALKTTNYIRWDEFRKHLAKALDALSNVYKPTLYSRIGLRYVDVIKRSKLQLTATPWSELIKPHLAGEFLDHEIAARIESAAREVSIQLENGKCRVVVRHGIVVSEPDGEQCFVIDSDFFTTSRTEVPDAAKRLDNFNRHARNLFRWCIHDKLHERLAPKPP